MLNISRKQVMLIGNKMVGKWLLSATAIPFSSFRKLIAEDFNISHLCKYSIAFPRGCVTSGPTRKLWTPAVFDKRPLSCLKSSASCSGEMVTPKGSKWFGSATDKREIMSYVDVKDIKRRPYQTPMQYNRQFLAHSLERWVSLLCWYSLY